MPENTLDIALANGAEVYPLTYDTADLAGTFTFGPDWGAYQADNVLIDSTVHPEFDDDGISEDGTFIVSVPLGQFAVKSSAHVRWDGGDIEVSYTLNGTTWNVITNGAYIPLTGSSDLDIRVTFAGGTEDDPAVLSRITVYVLATDTIFSSMGRRDIDFEDMTLSETQDFQLALGGTSGSLLHDGYLDILPDTNTVYTEVKTIEFWAKKNNSNSPVNWVQTAAANMTINNTRVIFDAGFLVWIDGSPKTTNTFDITLDQWHHYRIQLAAESNDKIRIGQSLTGTNPAVMSIFGLALYADVQVGNYESSVTTPTLTVNETSSIQVTEVSPAYDIYAYAWSD